MPLHPLSFGDPGRLAMVGKELPSMSEPTSIVRPTDDPPARPGVIGRL